MIKKKNILKNQRRIRLQSLWLWELLLGWLEIEQLLVLIGLLGDMRQETSQKIFLQNKSRINSIEP
jgi:hypothetical protein